VTSVTSSVTEASAVNYAALTCTDLVSEEGAYP
jgi:hypothetical protein